MEKQIDMSNKEGTTYCIATNQMCVGANFNIRFNLEIVFCHLYSVLLYYILYDFILFFYLG